ncbi:DUF4349 domain-containing protein [Pokkaliibacter sp. CJK22405]|uniref:DUF4349 domain-containing protein n=1 Tax=Pokkaliibacter sp. CJK22405 TaxID=3384615 RepID=UPI0039854CEB
MTVKTSSLVQLAFAVSLGLALTGCEQSGNSDASQGIAAAPQAKLAMAPARFAAESSAVNDGSQQSYIEEKQYLRFELPASEVQPKWKAASDQCQPRDCEILSASIQQSNQQQPSADLTVRVARDKAQAFLDNLGQNGLIESTITRQDRTAEVIDVDAKLKNLQDVRDRLRALLNQNTGSLGDVVQLEKQLGDVQARLDSATSQRAYLANQTEKVRIDMHFNTEPSFSDEGIFGPLKNVLYDSGRIFVSTLSDVLYFIIQLIPWLIVIIPASWIGLRLLRKPRRR